MRLENKVAVITGAGSGIGRASACLFAREGASLVIADINDASGEKTVDTIKKEGGNAIFVRTDVSRAPDIERLVRATMEKFGRIDIFHNNAGILSAGTCEAMDEATWDYIYAVDVKSIFFSAKYAAPEMRKTGGGVILNTASNSVNHPSSGMCGYISAKSAVIALTKVLAVELAPDKIRVNCISPSLTDTGIFSGRPEGGPLTENLKEMVKCIPLGQRLVKPEEIAYAALYLASDEASMTTGINLIVDGGSGI